MAGGGFPAGRPVCATSLAERPVFRGVLSVPELLLTHAGAEEGLRLTRRGPNLAYKRRLKAPFVPNLESILDLYVGRGVPHT